MKNRLDAFSPLFLRLLLAAAICFIWGNSLEGPAASAAKSETVTRAVQSVLPFSFLNVRLMRKLAHFAEFAALGAVLTMPLCSSCRAVSKKDAGRRLKAAFCIAAIDEGIQLFNGRSAQITDVLLDFTGALTGFFLFLSVFFLLRRLRHKI